MHQSFFIAWVWSRRSDLYFPARLADDQLCFQDGPLLRLFTVNEIKIQTLVVYC